MHGALVKPACTTGLLFLLHSPDLISLTTLSAQCPCCASSKLRHGHACVICVSHLCQVIPPSSWKLG